MKKVITYGTYDLLHYGHISLLERAKSLGDYLIVGVTSDDYDKSRGKINNVQTLMERVAAIKALGIADEVIVEEYEGQKIDDIRRFDVDIFTVGSDWQGKFDYLSEYCQVVYLSRTEGISSTEIRTERNKLSIGLVGEKKTELTSLSKFLREVKYVNGIEAVCSNNSLGDLPIEEDYESLLDKVDAVYVTSHPSKHYEQIKKALLKGKHVLCEAPIALSEKETVELFDLAKEKNCILMAGVKTAFMTAYERMILLAKSGIIGNVFSVEATCTSIKDLEQYTEEDIRDNWNSITEWAPFALLPIFQILGTDFKTCQIATNYLNKQYKFDNFSKISFVFDKAVASAKVAKAVKAEGELIVSGTKGYIYVPAPWWKMDYFEVRYENPSDNRRYFYQLDGEGIRYEILAFVKTIENNRFVAGIDESVSVAMSKVMEMYYKDETYEIG